MGLVKRLFRSVTSKEIGSEKVNIRFVFIHVFKLNVLKRD